MSLVLIASILILLVAMGWSGLMTRRLRYWQALFLTATIGLMALRQILKLWGEAEIGGVASLDLAVSIMILLALFFLERTLIERSQAQKALQTSEDKFRVLVENAPDVIMTLDREGIILFINYTLPEYSVREVIGKKVSNYLSAEDWRLYKQALDEVFAYAEPRSLEVKAAGDTSWLVRLAPIKQNGKSDLAMVIAAEITERKRVEDALRISERKYKEIFELAPLGIYQSSLDGAILTANTALANMLGYESTDELLKSNLATDIYFNEEERRKLIDEYESVGAGLDVELRWKKKDGTPIWISLNAHSITDAEGHTQYYEGFVRDITERRRTEEALRASEERFSKAFHASPHSMVITLLDEGRYLDVNKSFLQITGYDREEVIGRTSGDLNLWVEAEGRAEVVKTLRERGSVSDMELKFRRKSGEEFVVLFSAEIITLDGKECLLTASTDITERKRAEEALRESEKRFRTLSEAAFEGICIHENGIILEANSAFADMTGYDLSELVGMSVLDFVNPESEELVAGRLLRPRDDPFEVSARRKDGSGLIVEAASRDLPYGYRTARVTAVRDITERKIAEEKQTRLQANVYKSAREWKLTFDSVESPLLILSLDGNIIRLNQAARQLASISDQDDLEWHIGSAGPGQPWQKAAELVNRIRHTRSRISCLIQDESNGNSWDIIASIFAAPDGDERIIIAARDITQTVKLQESLRRSETMSAMGALVAGVAHEVRNPLFSISATLDAFEARFGARGEYRRHINVLRGEVDRLNQLMGELLEYGRPHRLELANDSIEGAIAQAVASCAAIADRMRVRIDNRVTGAMQRVMMDRKRMAQVFQNLIENAIQHSASEGEVRIEAREEKRNGQAWISCRVKDDGPGFGAEELARAFEPFYTRRRGGTGLGLSIVQRIVEEHGGEVKAGNRAVRGAKVEVRLPCAGK